MSDQNKSEKLANTSHVIIDPGTAAPAPSSRPLSSIWRFICTNWLKLGGWKIEGSWPDHKKMVVIAAPHTSNWDGINMLAAAGNYRIKLNWMGKKSLVEGPFGGFVRWLGCVPVDRSANNDLVQQMTDAFAQRDEMVLAIPPEGTRSKTKGWKTGYYYIAHQARVPILMTVLDYGSKTIRVSGTLMPSGEYDTDLPIILTHYDGAKGKFSDR